MYPTPVAQLRTHEHRQALLEASLMGQGTGTITVRCRGRCTELMHDAYSLPFKCLLGRTCYAQVPTPLQAEGDMTLLFGLAHGHTGVQQVLGDMPLHVASRIGDLGTVQALLDSKADPEAQNEVTMWAVQPGACHGPASGGTDAVKAGAAPRNTVRACR